MALVLTRKPQETIILTTQSGERIVIITNPMHDRTRVIIDAPLTVKIVRGELEEAA